MNHLHYTQSTYGWVEDTLGEMHREPVYTPNMSDIIDGPDPDDSPVSDEEALTIMAKCLNGVLSFCFENSADGNPNLPLAFRRFCCVAWALRPEYFNHASLAAMAPSLSVTRASLSSIVRKFCDRHGVRNVLMKNETTRETYSKARKESHARRLKEKPGTPCEAPGSSEAIELIPTPFISTSVPSSK